MKKAQQATMKDTIIFSNILNQIFLVVPNIQDKIKEHSGVPLMTYRLVTNMFSEIEESRLIVPPCTFKMHWLPSSA